MAFTLTDIAKELGIDPATLQAKQDVVNKWNGYLTEADTKYQSATQAQRDAEAKLEQVQREQQVIDQNIQQFGMTEANIASLRANNAAMEASLKTLKEQGFDVNIPTMPAAQQHESEKFDPKSFQNDVNASLIAGFDMNNKYQRLYGKAMPDDLQTLLREAQQVRKPLAQYVADKYDFNGREKSMRDEEQKKHDDEIRAAAIKEYQEKNPITAGNPELQRGIQSRYPQMMRPREAGDVKDFTRLSGRDKIARSLARTREALASQAS